MSDREQPSHGPGVFEAFYTRKWEVFEAGFLKDKRIDLLAARLFRHATRFRRFKDPLVEDSFKRKLERCYTAIAIGIPDRVPLISSGINFYPAYYSGLSFADYVNDRKKNLAAFFRFSREMCGFDAMFPSQIACMGPLIQATKLDVLKLPGIDLPDNVGYQYVERERLRPEEYRQFLDEKWDFFRKTILPRMSPLHRGGRGWETGTLLKAAFAATAYAHSFNHAIDIIEKNYGIPILPGAFSFAPYDLVSFLFRGLEGISGDLFRRAEDLEGTVDMMVQVITMACENIAVLSGINSAVILCERAFSLSPRQFKRFYMPYLKKLVHNLIDRGIIPLLALEQDCSHLIEFILELPPRKCIVNLDTSDIFKAKKILEGHTCIAGNVPMNLMVTGTPQDIRDYCARLIQELAPGGGFMMSGALGIPDNAREENVRAMIEYTLEQGKY